MENPQTDRGIEWSDWHGARAQPPAERDNMVREAIDLLLADPTAGTITMMCGDAYAVASIDEDGRIDVVDAKPVRRGKVTP